MLINDVFQTQELAFASVHDSYWTHAASIDKMSEVIRETFIALHSSDVLGKLHAEVCWLCDITVVITTDSCLFSQVHGAIQRL